jgi:glucose/arabinose dehydrogenase
MDLGVARGARRGVVIGAGVVALGAGAAGAQQIVKATPVATGLAYPLGLVSAPGDASRLFIVEQRGKIKVVDVLPGVGYGLRATPFVDVSAKLGSNALEHGLLGLAFHPDFAHNGYVFVTYTPPSPSGG